MKESSKMLTFILPCYNVESYIAECLDSLYLQDIAEYEYEVICVNDCSTDKTRDIILQYQSKHTNLKLIDHKVNKTAGGARNTGIEAAKGKYIWFVDPDDLIQPNSLSELLHIVNNADLDILMFNFDAINGTVNSIREVYDTYGNSDVMRGIDYVERYFNNRLSDITIVWQQLFKRDFIHRYFIRFPELRVGQDGFFSWKSILEAKRVQSITQRYYVYRLNSQSITVKKITADIIFAKYLQFAREIEDMLTRKDKYPEFIRKDLTQTATWSVNSFYLKINELDLSGKKQLCGLLKKNSKEILCLPYLNRKTRLAVSLSKINCRLFLVYCQLIGKRR